jgi:3'-phosphoadenosine 5'-phosphosulfate sulfotransferase (PAPS reductase)/FAD synthetase
MLSGGKDSLAVATLAKEYCEANDLLPVNAIFHDEEFLPPSNIAMLERLYHEDWLNLRWYCLPTQRWVAAFGKYHEVTQWDPRKEHLRPIPEFARTAEWFGYTPEEFMKADPNQDELKAKEFPGRVAFMTGIRASESLVRYRSVVNKLNENWICRIENNPTSRIRMVKPIYDWEENDVLKYLHESNVEWCSIYDAQELSGTGLRIAPPTVLGGKRFGEARAYEPQWYDETVQAAPVMHAIDRYAKDFDIDAFLEPYLVDGFPGVLRYIQDNIPPGRTREEAVKRYRMYVAMAENRPEEFPSEVLLRATASGVRERKIRGTDPNAKRRKK